MFVAFVKLVDIENHGLGLSVHVVPEAQAVICRPFLALRAYHTGRVSVVHTIALNVHVGATSCGMVLGWPCEVRRGWASLSSPIKTVLNNLLPPTLAVVKVAV